jgi:RNA polymerase sigma-54 factor
MLRQVQQQKMLQKLSPQQIQLVKLLEIPSIEMNERIMREVDENPALELGENIEAKSEDEFDYDDNQAENNDDFSLDDYEADDDIPDYKLQTYSDSSDNSRERVVSGSASSLNDVLMEQLRMLELDETSEKISEFIIGNIDEDGYLRSDATSISDDLAIILGIDWPISAVQELIDNIKQFDPPGVAAQNLQETLILQLERKNENKIINDAIFLLKNFFEEFSKKHYEVLVKKLDCTMDYLKKIIAEILKLNPKPGGAFESQLEQSMKQITPDFILENNDGFLSLSLSNGNIPELHVSRKYVEMVSDFKSNSSNQTREAKEALQFAKEKVDSAKWFIDSVKQRQDTLLRTMRAIVEYQKEYFIDGDEKKLKPMILKDISKMTGFDISTISRVSNSKYIQTEFGVFPLKYFFTEGMLTDTGEEVSALEIKTILQSSVDNEDKSNPLTDESLSEILSGKGYVIARRTIAKYREQLGIPVARLRREI